MLARPHQPLSFACTGSPNHLRMRQRLAFVQRTKTRDTYDTSKQHPNDYGNHGNIDGCNISALPYVLSSRNTVYHNPNSTGRISTVMASQGSLYVANVEHLIHENEVVLQTTEPSNLTAQPRRPSPRISFVASTPIFQRSPAPSPSPSEERNAFWEEQRIKIAALKDRKVNKHKLQ